MVIMLIRFFYIPLTFDFSEDLKKRISECLSVHNAKIFSANGTFKYAGASIAHPDGSGPIINRLFTFFLTIILM